MFLRNQIILCCETEHDKIPLNGVLQTSEPNKLAARHLTLSCARFWKDFLMKKFRLRLRYQPGSSMVQCSTTPTPLVINVSGASLGIIVPRDSST